MKTTNQQISELLKSSKTAKDIFIYIDSAKTEEIGEALIDLVFENANDFTKDIANKFRNGAELSQKQAWCLAFQIFNNLEVYILAQNEIENAPINVEEIEATEKLEEKEFTFEIIDSTTMNSIMKVESFEKGVELINEMPNKKDLFVSEIENN